MLVSRSRLLSIIVVLAAGCHTSHEGDGRAPRPSARQALLAPRTPEEIRRDGNHLLGSGSAYLVLHAHNPVDWYPWGPEALAMAVNLDRPIFLSIGYVSCHWCHVMEKEVFEQDDVAAYLNEHFMSIKVDREERPDLDAVYMDAVQAMTGSGGWPMTVFLTPSLRPFFGGTYFPHDHFLDAARAGAAQFREGRSAVESRSADVYARIAAALPTDSTAELNQADVRSLARRSLAQVDQKFGGLRGRTKFPTPIKWKLLVDVYRKWGDPDVAQALIKTLDAMSQGGLRDHVGGGFFRYSTEPTWTVPHFEKMLYDNAQLAALYLEAAAALNEPRYRSVGLDTLDFILQEMTTPQQTFGASFDADAGAKEGSTYLWTPAEVRAALGEREGSDVAALLGLTDAGNFEGSNVPTRMGTQRATAEDAQLWEHSRPKLREVRRKRVQPMFDAKTVTGWNGLAIAALALGFRASGERRFLDGAERAADAVWRLNFLATGELARASDNGKPGSGAVLDDYAFLSEGLIQLFQCTGNALYLQHALWLAERAMQQFGDAKGAWFLTSGSEQEPLGRRVELYDGVEPSGNAAMISALEQLAILTGRDDLRRAADLALLRFSGDLQQKGIDMAGSLDAALMAGGPFYEVVIAGDATTLVETWNNLLPSWAVGVRVGRDGPSRETEKLVPSTQEKRSDSGRAWICERGSCKPPTSDRNRFREQLLAGWAR